MGGLDYSLSQSKDPVARTPCFRFLWGGKVLDARPGGDSDTTWSY